MRRSAFAAAWLACAALARTQAPDSELKAVEERRYRAMIQADVPALEKLLADDLVYVHSSGRVEDKAQFLDSLRAGRIQYKRIAPKDTRYRVSGSVGVVSFLTMSATGQSTWRLGGTHVPGIKHVANAYCYRCPFSLSYPSCDLRCARDIEDVIQTTTSGRIAAFIAEPIQGVGRFIVPPPEYFHGRGRRSSW